MFQNHWRERESFYIYSSTVEEMEKHECTKSVRFASAAEACAEALKMQGVQKVAVERHYEFFDGYYREWEIDWNQGGGRLVVWSYDFVTKLEIKA